MKTKQTPKSFLEWISIHWQMFVLTLEVTLLRWQILWMTRHERKERVSLKKWTSFEQLKRGSLFITSDGRMGLKCERLLVAPILPDTWQNNSIYVKFSGTERVHEVDPRWLFNLGKEEENAKRL